MADASWRGRELTCQSIKEMDLFTNAIYYFSKGHARKTACISQGRLTAIYKNPKGLFLAHIPGSCGPVGVGRGIQGVGVGGLRKDAADYGHSETTTPFHLCLPIFQGLGVSTGACEPSWLSNERKGFKRNWRQCMSLHRILATTNCKAGEEV